MISSHVRNIDLVVLLSKGMKMVSRIKKPRYKIWRMKSKSEKQKVLKQDGLHSLALKGKRVGRNKEIKYCNTMETLKYKNWKNEASTHLQQIKIYGD